MEQGREDETRCIAKMRVVNHVMSNGIHSGIFDEFIGYLERYGNAGIQHVTSVEPIETANVYHYHRPNIVKQLKQPSLVTVHHDPQDNDPWLDFAKFAAPYREAARIVCLNHSQQEWLDDRGFKEKTIVIPHGYNSTVLRPTDAPSVCSKVTLGLASRRYGRRVKGEALLLDICKRLSPSEFKFILVGAGRSQEGHHLRSLGFEVVVYEFLPYRLFQQFYQAIDALLITSWFEGGPACVPEAVATGTPMVATRVGMVPDYLVPGENGLFLEGRSSVDAETIRALVNPELLDELRRGAQVRTSRAATWQNVAEMYSQVYSKLCGDL